MTGLIATEVYWPVLPGVSTSLMNHGAFAAELALAPTASEGPVGCSSRARPDPAARSSINTESINTKTLRTFIISSLDKTTAFNFPR
ncbi:MAG: hypothetical protein WBD62_02375 [Anaerolineales bacterium]